MAAMIDEAQGKRDSAVAGYERALGDNPRAGVAANNLAWIRAEEGRVDDAVRLAGIAVDTMKNRPEPHDTLGWAYYKQGLSGRAISSSNARWHSRRRTPPTTTTWGWLT